MFAGYYARFAALQPLPPLLQQQHRPRGAAVGTHIANSVPVAQYKASVLPPRKGFQRALSLSRTRACALSLPLSLSLTLSLSHSRLFEEARQH